MQEKVRSLFSVIVGLSLLTSMSFSAVVGEPVLESGGSSCLDPVLVTGGFSSCLQPKIINIKLAKLEDQTLTVEIFK